jgi:hypothetical protein
VVARQPLIIFASALLALACICTASAQQPRDPLIDPPSGEAGSRFQIVGQFGWIPGETVTLRLALTTAADPLTYAGPFPYTREITVLRDGTWSFPIVATEDVLGFPFGAEPGFIVVRAEAPSHTSTNAWILTVSGARPSGADAIAEAGFGPIAPPASLALALGLFAMAVGTLLLVSAAQRTPAAR